MAVQPETETKAPGTPPWHEFLELTKDWPRIKIGSGGPSNSTSSSSLDEAPAAAATATTVPFSAAHLYKNSLLWRKALEGGGNGDEAPKELLTQNRINPATDIDFQRVWMYLNGFVAAPDDLSEIGEQYLGYFGGDTTPLPPKILEALKPLKRVFQDRQEVFSGEKEALDLINKYTRFLHSQTTANLEFEPLKRSPAAKRMLERAGFNIQDIPNDTAHWRVEFVTPAAAKRARKM